MDNHLLNRLQAVFRTFFKNESIHLTETTTTEEIENWDSITHLNLINEIENQFGISFSFEEILKMKNVGELIEIINSKGI
jgi:acyl carrier protein